jgi:5-methylcytosine-specific restriction endonuclease McrA
MTKLKIQPNTTVLVLNSSYEPLNITSWKRAIILLLKEKAQVLSNRVIRLLSYIKLPVSRIASHKPSKSMIYKRDENKCQYCGSTRHLTIDHVIPKSKGGDDSWFNLALACSQCNTKKGDKLLEHSGMKLLRHPKAPISRIEFLLLENNVEEWNEYFFLK